MAHVTHGYHLSSRISHYYNVSAGVGRRRENQREDVYLVQFLLRQVRTDRGWLIEPRIKADGWFGPKTRDAILRFQEYWNRSIPESARRVAQDSVVSPARASSYGGGTMTWTILALNRTLVDQAHIGPDRFAQLHTHPDCPPALRSLFANAPAAQEDHPHPPLELLLDVLDQESGDDLSPPSPSEFEPANSDPEPIAPPIGSSGGGTFEEQGGGGTATETPPTRSSRRRRFFRYRRGGSAHQLTRPPLPTPPRPFDPHDPGVVWSRYIIQPIRSLFTTYEYSEIMEAMEGADDQALVYRLELLRQVVGSVFGETLWMSGLSIGEIRIVLGQMIALGGQPRPTGRRRHY